MGSGAEVHTALPQSTGELVLSNVYLELLLWLP